MFFLMLKDLTIPVPEIPVLLYKSATETKCTNAGDDV